MLLRRFGQRMSWCAFGLNLFVLSTLSSRRLCAAVGVTAGATATANGISNGVGGVGNGVNGVGAGADGAGVGVGRSSPLFQAVYSAYPEGASLLHPLTLSQLELACNCSALGGEGAHKRAQFYDLHLPVYWYVSSLLSRHRKGKGGQGPLFVGISAPQGCGKTTLTSILTSMFEAQGLSCLSVSLDDFYLTGAQQEQLANKYAHNAL
eukprot:CAMPEP_0173207138 /NCGR_PEP_ID=MMETSP1141-20130122/21765_1 /TAXON_ID=483371 /ORGANISM="non described non described, Strain CCMP2298" /LENGTH=206 /DNA_ID=CAMNT_0014133387 /DNA_START=89 /DNA_END=706 /DNA_ORIENTATION=+